jgi:4-alpha-glucanotransferase
VPFDDALRAAAQRCGVQQEFWDVFGKLHVTDTDTNRAILTALGYECGSEEVLGESVRRREVAEASRRLPAVLVVDQGMKIDLPADSEIRLEDGELRTSTENLPIGYHEVRAGDETMRLIVAPERAHAPSPGKHAGFGVTLYGLRSSRNWGCGDFRDLRELIDWAIPCLHADFIALNPLHAIHNRAPYNTSPYLPNSVFYRNFIYLDIESVPGFEQIRESILTAETAAEIENLRATEVVEYERVASLKRRALEAIFEANPPGADCRGWIQREGDLLRLYAIYCALDEHLHLRNPEVWVWRDWPEEFRDPSNSSVKSFAEQHEREILFHGWVQWLIDRQLSGVQRHALASGMKIGLYHDLALATDRCGSDLWAHRSLFVDGARVGSPPDGFSPTGQDWSFPPPNSERHRAEGYRHYVETIRKTMRHGGALRIDHVMRLFRLYWIPEGHDATRGAYVRDRPEDLVRILALESVRHGAVIVGEDLGTVEPEVRAALERFGILSYRLLIFERGDRGFKLPHEYPPQALTSTTTHDLPTIAGFWTGRDIEARYSAGAIDRAAFESQSRERVADRQKLLDALFDAGLLPQDYEHDASRFPELTPELRHAIAGFLALTPCFLWLINQEDLTLGERQQNLPGTTAEYPNWRGKIRWSLDDLRSLPEAQGTAAMFRHWVSRSGRA